MNADGLAFGIITADFRPTPLSFGSNEETMTTLNEIDPSGVLTRSFLDYNKLTEIEFLEYRTSSA